MKRITVHRHPDCARCARIARAHRFFDWLGRVGLSTEVPRTGPLQLGQIVVEDLRTGEILEGVAAVRAICREIPAYAIFRPLLLIPAVARAVDRDVRGCSDGRCAIAPSEVAPGPAKPN